RLARMRGRHRRDDRVAAQQPGWPLWPGFRQHGVLGSARFPARSSFPPPAPRGAGGMHSLRHRIPAGALLIALLCVSALGGHAASRALETRMRQARTTGDVGPLPDGKALRVLSLGFDRLICDLFWVRTIYYVGDDASQAAGYPAVERLANL